MNPPLRKPRILIGCEESAKVRDAFLRSGFDAWSCDFQPTRGCNVRHLRMDVRKAITDFGPWAAIILFPDCTKMAVSGNGTYAYGKPGWPERVTAVQETRDLWNLAKRHAVVGCALENPVGVLWSSGIGTPQYIQPHMFGHAETKKTGILLHNLPPLQATNQVPPPYQQRVWRMPPGPNRKRDRSETYQGVADAMAEQWGSYCLERSLP